jgi:mono/diheme cytochrome c family protein
MIRPTIFLILICVILGCGKDTAPKTSAPTKPQPSPQPVVTTNGLEGDEQTLFHHLAEGSEIYPLTWLLALTNPDTGEPFLKNPERFGLIPDPASSPNNPYGLPIGLTAGVARDLNFADFQMVGVNCAACHVNELQLNGQRVALIDGAPNLFDLALFYGDIARATKDNLSTAGKAFAFFCRIIRPPPPSDSDAFMAMAAKTTEDIVNKFSDLDKLRQGNTLEKALADQIVKIHEKQLAQPVLDLGKQLRLSHPDKPLSDHVTDLLKPKGSQKAVITQQIHQSAQKLRRQIVGKVIIGDPKTIADQPSAADSPLAHLDLADRADAITEFLTHFGTTLGLLRARAAFLLQLAGGQGRPDTKPGFGRIDAFGGARNFIFPNQNLALNAPISYPHLWPLNQIKWLHWDGNTTSLLERNVGQAIGLGAVFNPETFESTVLVSNITELERLARKITPPAWPEEALGKIDAARRDRGKLLFDARCKRCHTPLGPGETIGDNLSDLPTIGTDPLRAENFARPVNGQAFNEALFDALKKITLKANGTPSAKLDWRITRSYAKRPLIAIWATAPYLHNNSVPTLDDLLKPADQRPAKFYVRSREYDKDKLGFKSDTGDAVSEFDTTQPGNSNAGHSGSEYGTDWSEEQRKDVLEYLKGVK